MGGDGLMVFGATKDAFILAVCFGSIVDTFAYKSINVLIGNMGFSKNGAPQLARWFPLNKIY